MTDINRLRRLARNDRRAAVALLHEARRRGDADMLREATGALGLKGAPFCDTKARWCRWGRDLMAPLYEGLQVLAEAVRQGYSGRADVVALDPVTGEIVVHGWSWGSCSHCDRYERHLYEEFDPERVERARERLQDEERASMTRMSLLEFAGHAALSGGFVPDAARYVFEGVEPEVFDDGWGPQWHFHSAPLVHPAVGVHH